MGRKSACFALVAVSLFGPIRPVWADCPDGVRDPSPAELAFAARAAAALAAALPAPIPSSERRGAPYDFSSQPTLSFCRTEPQGHFSPSVRGAYLYTFPKAEADRRYVERKRVEQQIENLEKLPAEKEAQYQRLLADMRAAYAAAPRRQRKDPPFTPEQQAQVDRANAEGAKLEAAAKQVVTDHKAAVRPQADLLRTQADRLAGFPQEIAVGLAMNLDRLPPAGPRTLAFGAASAGRSAGLRVHNVVIEVAGPEGEAVQAFFDAVDKTYLKSLLGQAPPEVVQSKDRADRTTMAAAAAAPAVPPPAPAPPSTPDSRTAAAAAAIPPPAPEPTRAGRDEPAKTPAPAPTAKGAAQTVKKLRGMLGR